MDRLKAGNRKEANSHLRSRSIWMLLEENVCFLKSNSWSNPKILIWQADTHKYLVTQVEGNSTVLKYELFAFLYSTVCCKLPVGPVYSLPTCSRLKITFYLKSFQFTIHSDVILHKHLRELTATPTHLQEEVAFSISESHSALCCRILNTEIFNRVWMMWGVQLEAWNCSNLSVSVSTWISHVVGTWMSSRSHIVVTLLFLEKK